jgi:hypothetical protein
MRMSRPMPIKTIGNTMCPHRLSSLAIRRRVAKNYEVLKIYER